MRTLVRVFVVAVACGGSEQDFPVHGVRILGRHERIAVLMLCAGQALELLQGASARNVIILGSRTRGRNIVC